MSFSERLKLIQNVMIEDTERCLQIISNKAFISSIFCQELKSLVNMFENLLQKKIALSKNLTQEKTGLRPQIIIAFYSIIILRESSINIRHQSITTIATKFNNLNESVYNSKLAIETLIKIYKNLEENDQTRQIITGLLLKIKGFNNYKMIVRDLNPAYVSQEALSTHFQALKSQCPNLLQNQLIKYKTKWFKYLRYKPIELQILSKLFGNLTDSQQEQSISFWDSMILDIQAETSYILNRLSIINNGEQLQRINLDELIKTIDDIIAKLMERIRQTALVSKKSNKNQILNPEYDFKQFIHKNYLKFLFCLLKIVNSMINNIGINWLRRVKWLYNFVLDLFIGFNIKSNQFHQSIAQQYSNILLLNIKIVTNLFLTFKIGLFPLGKLLDIVYRQEYSFSKLIEAILYNEYPFNQSEIVQFQNYQKQRNNHQNKNKQTVIDIVNFNMKSLNINPHWDNLFMKIIPNLKNSIKFAKEILNQALYFMLRYYELSQNFQGAAKFLLLLQNAKNTFFIKDPSIKRLILSIKSSIYPEKKQIREGIEYFCEEYWTEYLKIGKRREQEQIFQRKNNKHLQVCNLEAINITSHDTLTNKLKKTQSHQAIIQGWDNFESVKDSIKDSLSDLKGSINRPLMQSVEVINTQMFYSVTSKNQKMMDQRENQQEQAKQIEEENQILLPDF